MTYAEPPSFGGYGRRRRRHRTDADVRRQAPARSGRVPVRPRGAAGPAAETSAPPSWRCSVRARCTDTRSSASCPSAPAARGRRAPARCTRPCSSSRTRSWSRAEVRHRPARLRADRGRPREGGGAAVAGSLGAGRSGGQRRDRRLPQPGVPGAGSGQAGRRRRHPGPDRGRRGGAPHGPAQPLPDPGRGRPPRSPSPRPDPPAWSAQRDRV